MGQVGVDEEKNRNEMKLSSWLRSSIEGIRSWLCTAHTLMAWNHSLMPTIVSSLEGSGGAAMHLA
jgi:hypothetical protein